MSSDEQKRERAEKNVINIEKRWEKHYSSPTRVANKKERTEYIIV